MREYEHMNAIATPQIPAEVMADAQLVAEHVAAGKPIPREVARRVQERADRIRRRVFEEQGLVDIAVPTLRAVRDELPE
jgi:hypothetical protein